MATEKSGAAQRCAQDGCPGLRPDDRMCPYGYGASCRTTEIPRPVAGHPPGVPALSYVAVRWPESHVVFHLTADDPAAYEEIRLRVNESVREALDAMGVAFNEEYRRHA